MALSDELTALLARTGPDLLNDAHSFGAALDDFVTPAAASRGVHNLLVDAVRQGAIARLQRDIEHGGDPSMAVAAAGDQLARDRASNETGPSRWAVAILGHALGVVDEATLSGQEAPETKDAAPAPAPPSAPPTAPPPGPPLGPPTAAPPMPPTVARPSGPPPAPPGRPRRRTGRLVGASLLTLVVIGGGITAALVLTRDQAPTRDPKVIAADLRNVMDQIYPEGAGTEIYAQSWSVEQDNLDDEDGYGGLNELSGEERKAATQWTVTSTTEATRVFLTIEHVPPDAKETYEQACGDAEPTSTYAVECAAFRTSDGRTGIERWTVSSADELEYAVHTVITEPAGRDIPYIEVEEYLNLRPDEIKKLSLSDLKAQLTISSGNLRRAVEDERLLLPRPADEPPLPSIRACQQLQVPDDCPDDLT